MIDADPPRGGRSLAGRRLLVVDDSPAMRALVGRLLAQTGAAIDTADDGERGLALAAVGGYDAALLDIEMPGMGGLDVAFRLRADGDATPLLAVTAHSGDTARQRFLAGGFDDVLVKPFGKDDLARAVNGVIARRAAAPA